jgi:hypothetical protein
VGGVSGEGLARQRDKNPKHANSTLISGNRVALDFGGGRASIRQSDPIPWGGRAMLIFEALVGLVVVVVTGTAFWYFMPRNGRIHPWVTAPYLESTIPFAILSGLVLGLAMIGAGVLPMMLGANSRPRATEAAH